MADANDVEAPETSTARGPGAAGSAGTVVRVRRRRTAIWVAGAIGVVLAVLVVILATSPDANEIHDGSPLVDKPAPGLAGTTLDGQPFDLAALRGKYVLVNFFASWCTPCLQEHPQLVSLETRHKAAGDVQLVGVLFQDDPKNAKQFMSERGGTWPIIENRDAIANFGVRGPPESFLIGPNGIVLYKRVGPATADQWDDLISSYQSAGLR